MSDPHSAYSADPIPRTEWLDPRPDENVLSRASLFATPGRPITFYMSAGQVSDYTGAAALLRELPEADCLIADKEVPKGRGSDDVVL